MSPKSLIFVFVVALCASQMVSAHRQARGVADLMETAKLKLSGLMKGVESTARASVAQVWKYINELETSALKAGTKALHENGIEVDLTAVAGLFKSNIKICTSDDDVRKEAKTIINNVASCVTKDVASMKKLVEDMNDLWKTAQELPNVMQDVAKQCSRSSGDQSPTAPTDTFADAEEGELFEDTNQLLEDSSHRLSKRAFWGLGRITSCIKSVFSVANTDMKTLPGDIMSTAVNAYRVLQSAQGGIQACVAQRMTQNLPALANLSRSVSVCVARGVSSGDDLEEVIKKSPSLSSLKQLSELADKIEEATAKGSGALSGLQQIAGMANKLQEVKSTGSGALAAFNTVSRLVG